MVVGLGEFTFAIWLLKQLWSRIYGRTQSRGRQHRELAIPGEIGDGFNFAPTCSLDMYFSPGNEML